MGLINTIYDEGFITSEYLKIFTLLLSPFAPHVAEEMWSECNLGSGFASTALWPEYDQQKCTEKEVPIVLQVNGKMRGKVFAPFGIVQDEVLELAKKEDTFNRAIEEKNIVKVIYVPGRILNVVAK